MEGRNSWTDMITRPVRHPTMDSCLKKTNLRCPSGTEPTSKYALSKKWFKLTVTNRS